MEGDNLDPVLERTVFTSLYYLYSSLPAEVDYAEPHSGLSPGGLANGGRFTNYRGHVFWDQVDYNLIPRKDLQKMSFWALECTTLKETRLRLSRIFPKLLRILLD